MPSQRQLDANRRNAALGGPKTPEGRAAVRCNALDHGLSASITVLPGEDPKAFQQLREDLFQDYLPANYTERMLFEEFARCSWKLLRLRRVENEIWSEYIFAIRRKEGVTEAPTQQEADRALAGVLVELPEKKLANYWRYERAITRDFYRALHELERAQRERRRRQPIPAADALTEKMQNEPETALTVAPSAASAVHTSAQTLSQAPTPPLSDFGIGTVLSTGQSARADEFSDPPRAA
jgi:hypothetical protein